MLKELRNGKFVQNIATEEEVSKFVEEATRMITAYGWEDRTVTPWGYAEKVTKTVKTVSEYPACTFGTKQTLITLANGLARVMNAWEQQELTDITLTNTKTGRTVKVPEELADIYLQNGFIRV